MEALFISCCCYCCFCLCIAAHQKAEVGIVAISQWWQPPVKNGGKRPWGEVEPQPCLRASAKIKCLHQKVPGWYVSGLFFSEFKRLFQLVSHSSSRSWCEIVQFGKLWPLIHAPNHFHGKLEGTHWGPHLENICNTFEAHCQRVSHALEHKDINCTSMQHFMLILLN